MTDLTGNMVSAFLGIWTVVGVLLIIWAVLAIAGRWPRWPKVYHTETDITSVGVGTLEETPKPKAKSKPTTAKLPTKLSFKCEKCDKTHEIDASTKTLKCDCGAEYEFYEVDNA